MRNEMEVKTLINLISKERVILIKFIDKWSMGEGKGRKWGARAFQEYLGSEAISGMWVALILGKYEATWLWIILIYKNIFK